MPPMIPAGPYRTLTTPEGTDFPYYVIPFDKDGGCEGPETLKHLISKAPHHTDIFVFSHGWNNDWTAATKRYENFINGFMKLRVEHSLPAPAGYRPLLVGIFWPSQALAWFESEQGPDFAALDPDEQDAAASASKDLLTDIAAELPTKERERFYELAQADQLDEEQATELAAMLASLVSDDDEAFSVRSPSADDLLAAASAMTLTEPDYDEVGVASRGKEGAPEAAFDLGGVLKALDPRNLIKPFTVWQMKDRAGKVGAKGAARLLEALLTPPPGSSTEKLPRVHLVGHSFGCKVVMTAASTPKVLARPIESALLLQPAVSQYAFAGSVPDRDVPGGFYKALERINRPILTTFSAHDVALTKFFHLAVRRHDDLGELQMAAGGSPSRFGALGGFGPQATNAGLEPIHDPLEAYDLTGPERIMGLKADRTIGSHGDISNPSTWWALYELAMGPHSVAHA